MRTNFHYLLISSSLSPRITLGRAYTLVLLDILLFFLPNSVISMFSQLKNSAPGKIKLSKLYFCLGCFSPHFSSYHAFTSWMDVLFLDSEISILCRRSDISPVHTWDSLGVRLSGSFLFDFFYFWQHGSQTLWELWLLQVLIGTKKLVHNPFQGFEIIFLHILVHVMRFRLQEGIFSVRPSGSSGSCCKFW